MFYNKKAFTLIELLVWITILGLLTMWITKLYSSNIPDKQKLDLFTNKFVWTIDSIKNYSLVWKWIWSNLETPKYFKIELSKSWSYLKTFYNTWWLSDIYYNQFSLDPFWEYYDIYSISCKNLDLTNTDIITSWNMSIIYEWTNIVLSWCTDSYQKVVDIELYYKWFKNIIRLNTISWVLEEIR